MKKQPIPFVHFRQKPGTKNTRVMFAPPGGVPKAWARKAAADERSGSKKYLAAAKRTSGADKALRGMAKDETGHARRLAMMAAIGKRKK